MNTGMYAIIGVIFIIIILNVYYALSRAGKSVKRKGGRNYLPPDEKKQAEWRDKEIARRLEREQDEAYERVMLRNETLSYYELVRKKYEKKEALERLGINVNDNTLDEADSIAAAASEDYQFRDIRDDIYVDNTGGSDAGGFDKNK